MNSRRTFLKVLSFFGAMVVPWTILPQQWRQSIGFLIDKPAIKVEIAKAEGADGSGIIDAAILSRKGFEDIQVLCHADMQGRRAATIGETRTLVYIEEQLRALRLEPFGKEKYLQPFPIPAMEERVINGRALFRPQQSNSSSLPCANLLAGIKGKNQKEMIIISAHYDHLGIYNGKVHRGANDNASGVGCVLEVMRRLVREKIAGSIPRVNVVAAFWGAEEMGFLGSKYFVKNPTIPLSDIKAVVNFDTIASGANKDFILWTPNDNPVIDVLRELGQKNGAKIERVEGQGHRSDDSSFVETGIPAVTVLSREWLWNNHTEQDDITIINKDKLQLASDILYDTVKRLAY